MSDLGGVYAVFSLGRWLLNMAIVRLDNLNALLMAAAGQYPLALITPMSSSLLMCWRAAWSENPIFFNVLTPTRASPLRFHRWFINRVSFRMVGCKSHIFHALIMIPDSFFQL